MKGYKNMLILLMWTISNILVPSSQSMLMPAELRAIMAKVNSIESFKSLMKIRDRKDVTRSSPDHSGVELENKESRPRPLVVPVPQPEHDHGFTYPFFVKLHRCAGSCNVSPKILHCVVQENVLTKIKVYRVTWCTIYYNNKAVVVRMANHTRCQCWCVARPLDCDPETQVWQEENCRCLCKPIKSCPKHHVWDSVNCKCRCSVSSPQSCQRRMEWNQDKCQCVCKKRKCRYGKHRDSNCICVSPKINCPAGKTLVFKTCRCRNSLSRVAQDK